MLRTATEMQNDVEMTSRIAYFRFISLFGNNFTKISYKLDENTSLSRNWSKTTILAVLVLSAPVTMATAYKFEICY